MMRPIIPAPKESPRLAFGLAFAGLALLALALQLAPGELPDDRAPLHPGRVLADIRYLSDPRCEGRGVGLPGTTRAMAHIEAAFREAGLVPVARGGFRLPFPVTVGQGLGPACSFEQVAPETKKGALGSDWVPVVMSEKGSAEGPVFFAGHGISAPELRYDDYASIDGQVKGAWVMVLDHEPRERDPKSPFREPAAYRHRELRTKAIVAREKGAKGLILVTDSAQHPERTGDPLPEFDNREPVAAAGLLVVQVSRAVADRLLAPADTMLSQLETSIEKTLKPASLATGSRLKVSVDVLQRTETAYNLVGMLPGADLAKAGETVLIGAHYDHLGWGGSNSLAPGQRAVHGGADDNASGTAGVLALARELALNPRPGRAIAFACFSGEEMGLLGSADLARKPPPQLGKVVAMLNMDMVGRMKGNGVTVQGIDTAREWDHLVRTHGSAQRLAVTTASGGYGPSDHTSFLAHNIPVLFFFTGAHPDYHKPSDTWDKINAWGEVRVLKMVAGIASDLADRPRPIAFVAPTGQAPKMGSRGYGAWFGSVPDMSYNGPGVRISGTMPGSPAQGLGMMKDDIIVRLAGIEVKNLYDMTHALHRHRPGDTVDVEYTRGGGKISRKVTLKERRRR